jgi:hypothetical protein
VLTAKQPAGKGASRETRPLSAVWELNQAFESVVCGLERLEKACLFDKEQLRHSRAEVESARVDANREFFDKFDEIVEKDAELACKFRGEYDQKIKDPFDFYLEIKEREEARRRKALPPRVVLLPDWDKGDEQRYDEEPVRRRAAITAGPLHTGNHARNLLACDSGRAASCSGERRETCLWTQMDPSSSFGATNVNEGELKHQELAVGGARI